MASIKIFTVRKNIDFMPKGQKISKNLKPPLYIIAFLWLQFILVKIGNIPIIIVKSAVDRTQWTVKKLLSFHIPPPALQLKPVTYNLFSHKRGRPRNSWFLFFYLKKLRFFIKKRISTKYKITIGTLFVVFILYFYTTFIFITAYQLPTPKKLVSSDKALTTEFYDRNGTLLYRLYEGRNRTLVLLSQVPQYLIQATIAAEDKNFYSHVGIDPLAIIRAINANFQNHQLEGGSTITQQLIKNTLLTPEKTYTRKIKEIILSLWAERIYSKDEILQMYLNEAPYGGPAWGIEAASQTYFGETAHDLTLAQSAYLAGLPASPTQFSPYGSNPELGKIRQKDVLKRMVENKFLTQNQSDLAYSEDLHLKPQITSILAPHFVMYVKDLLSQKYGQRVVSQGGLKIITTLDLNLQSKVEKIVAQEIGKLAPLNVSNGAAMITEAKTGQILAMLGSYDYDEPLFGSFNVALALRQPGSSIKVVTYATGFKKGFTPGNTILDVPVNFKDNWGKSYAPVNYDGKFHGPVSIRQALGSSYNIPAVKMLATVGVDDMINTAKDLGITTFTDPSRYGLSLTLGGAEVKMIDMMTLYGTLSQNGIKNISTPILKVTDSDNNVLEEYGNHPTQAVSAEVAYLITDILKDNSARTPAFGANSQLFIPGYTVAVKTGTSDNKRDNWTFGYTPQFVVGVWVGNNDNSPMNPRLASGVTGAAPIWNKIMTALVSGKSDQAFVTPAGIMQAQVDGRKDLAIANNLPKTLVRVAKKDTQILFSDSFSSFATSSARLDRTTGSQL